MAELRYLSKDEVAALLRVSVRTLDSLRSQGRFPEPTARVGRRLLWSTTEVESYARSGGSKGVNGGRH